MNEVDKRPAAVSLFTILVNDSPFQIRRYGPNPVEKVMFVKGMDRWIVNTDELKAAIDAVTYPES